MKKDIYKKTLLIHGGMGLIMMLGMMCGLLAFDASQHTASAATHSVHASHHGQESNGKSPTRRRSTSHYHYTTTHHYYSSSSSGWPFDTATSVVILVVCVIIGIFFSVFKWLRQDDYDE